MAEQYKKPYLESSVFIAWIKGEAIPLTDASGKVIGCEERGNIGKHILSLAEAGQFQVFTSSITITEVHKSNSNGQSSTESTTIDFFRNSFFKVIDVDRSIAESAHRLCRKHGLKPYDAVHLACAVRAGCDALLTWDTDLLRISDGGITIEKPQALGQGELDLAVPAESVPIIVSTVTEEPSGDTPEGDEAHVLLETAVREEPVAKAADGVGEVPSGKESDEPRVVEPSTRNGHPTESPPNAAMKSASEGTHSVAAPDNKPLERETAAPAES